MLATGVCRTPPVRGKGGAHLSRSVCGTHTDLSSAHDADTGALLKEVVRVHARTRPTSAVNLEQQRKLAKDLVRAARGATRPRSRASWRFALTARRRRDRSSLPTPSCRRPRGRLRVVAEARRRSPGARRRRRSAKPCGTATLPARATAPRVDSRPETDQRPDVRLRPTGRARRREECRDAADA